MKLLVKKNSVLKKFNGKGGWTYTELNEVKPNKNNPFGWVQVCGCIDDVEIKQYKLMPLGNGKLFLPVKAAIRKQIKKEAGDKVYIELYLDESTLEIPIQFIECLKDEPIAYRFFLGLKEIEQQKWVKYIYASSNVVLQDRKILITINALLKKIKNPSLLNDSI